MTFAVGDPVVCVKLGPIYGCIGLVGDVDLERGGAVVFCHDYNGIREDMVPADWLRPIAEETWQWFNRLRA